MKPRIVITLGDPAGIGPEIVSKAIRESAVLDICEPIVVGDPTAFVLDQDPWPNVEMLSVPGPNKKIALGKPSKEAGLEAIESVRLAVGLIHARQASALVTAPASKTSLQLAGLKHPGHTEWLVKEFGTGPGSMLMVAGALRAVLVTRHIALSDVSSHLTKEALILAATQAYAFARNILKKSKPRIAFCGVNPHAGDSGLLGREELTVYPAAIKLLKSQGIPVVGPFPADSLFRDMLEGDYDVALAAYHDQGMIPLKLHAAPQLVNVTLGLPFVRTAPGHGTAYDIAGKHKADHRPMVEAIRLAAAYSASAPSS